MKFQTQLTAKDIFKFSMMYTYSGASGIFSIVMIIVGFLCAFEESLRARTGLTL